MGNADAVADIDFQVWKRFLQFQHDGVVHGAAAADYQVRHIVFRSNIPFIGIHNAINGSLGNCGHHVLIRLIAAACQGVAQVSVNAEMLSARALGRFFAEVTVT